MELIALTVIMLLATGAGLAAAGATLWTVFVCMSRLAVPCAIAHAPTAGRVATDDPNLGDAAPLAPAA
jgi:hypothetical protein